MVNVAFFALEFILNKKIVTHEGGSLWVIGGQILENLGSSRESRVLDGEVWRLVSACFLHAGALHVGCNMYVFFSLGRTCEPLIGTHRFLTTYLACGLLASSTSFVWHLKEVGNSASVDASGAIAGLIGLLLGFSIRHRDRQLRRQIIQWIIFMAVISLVMSSSQTISLDHAGHIGGLVAGFVFGLFIPPYVSSQSGRRWKIPCWIAIAVTAACLGISVWTQYQAWNG